MQQWMSAHTLSKKLVMQYGIIEAKEFSEYIAINCNIQQIRQLYAMVYLVLVIENELINNPHLKFITNDVV